jgi:hypothetical protein
MLSGCVTRCVDDGVTDGLLTDYTSVLDGWIHSWLTAGLRVNGCPGSGASFLCKIITSPISVFVLR